MQSGVFPPGLAKKRLLRSDDEPFMRIQGPFTQAEYEKFQSQQKRVISDVVVVFLFAGALTIISKFLHLEPPVFVIFMLGVSQFGC
jgi:hypothetical protein